MIEASRRSFISGLIALVAAPAIVRAGSIMPVKSYIDPVTAEDLAELMARLDDRAECLTGSMPNDTERPDTSTFCDL